METAPISPRPACVDNLADTLPAAMEKRAIDTTDPAAKAPRYTADIAAEGIANAGETPNM